MNKQPPTREDFASSIAIDVCCLKMKRELNSDKSLKLKPTKQDKLQLISDYSEDKTPTVHLPRENKNTTTKWKEKICLGCGFQFTILLWPLLLPSFSS